MCCVQPIGVSVGGSCFGGETRVPPRNVKRTETESTHHGAVFTDIEIASHNAFDVFAPRAPRL